jgi:hypothetical protein
MIVRARSITVRTADGFVDLFQGDELPKGISSADKKRLQEQGAIAESASDIPGGVESITAPEPDAISVAPASAPSTPDPNAAGGGEQVNLAEASDDDLKAWVADNTIADIKTAVGDDAALAGRVLAAEQSRGDDARSSLVGDLEKTAGSST